MGQTDFEQCMDFDARLTGPSISEAADFLGFSLCLTYKASMTTVHNADLIDLFDPEEARCSTSGVH